MSIGFRSVLTLTLALNSAEIFGSVRVCLTYWDYYVPWNSRCWRNDYDILDVTGIARTWGFKTSSYTLTLEDGYIISVFRVYKNITQKTPIVLGHGSVTNPFSWVFAGNNSLAYVLGNLGYDIWMMSWRGTIFSKTHVTLSNKDRAYWQFTFHQMGIYDVKSTMDLVYNITQEKAIYIGYSMGTTNSYVYCSILSEHCRQRLLGVVSFAPVGYMLGAKGLFAILWRPFCWHIVRHLTYFFLNGEFLKLTPSLKIVYRILSLTPLMNYIGITLFSFLYGFHIHTLDPTTTPVIFNRFQDTIGIEVYSHYSQNFNNKAFNQFDYGTQKNLELYGQSHPPAYPLDKIPVPVAMFVGRNDYLGTLEATSKMYSLLHSQAQCLYHIVSDPKYCHYDFIIAKHQSVLYEPMLKTIRLMEARTCT